MVDTTTVGPVLDMTPFYLAGFIMLIIAAKALGLMDGKKPLNYYRPKGAYSQVKGYGFRGKLEHIIKDSERNISYLKLVEHKDYIPVPTQLIIEPGDFDALIAGDVDRAEWVIPVDINGNIVQGFSSELTKSPYKEDAKFKALEASRIQNAGLIQDLQTTSISSDSRFHRLIEDHKLLKSAMPSTMMEQMMMMRGGKLPEF